MRRALAMTVLIVLTSCGKAIQQNSQSVNASPISVADGRFEGKSGEVGLWDRARGYNCAVFLPASYGQDPNRLYPLILSLHGYNGSVLNILQTAVGGNRSGFIKQVWNTPLATTFDAIVIAPHVYSVGSTENTLWNRSELRELILEAKSAFRVDPARIVVTGNSAGAIATQELVKYSHDLLAGAMPGAFQYLYAVNPCEFAKLPVWAFGNDSDGLFDASGWENLKDVIRACDGHTQKFKLEVNSNNCGHGCWDKHWARPEVQRWLVSQTR